VLSLWHMTIYMYTSYIQTWAYTYIYAYIHTFIHAHVLYLQGKNVAYP
jgi:hypothetical protein